MHIPNIRLTYTRTHAAARLSAGTRLISFIKDEEALRKRVADCKQLQDTLAEQVREGKKQFDEIFLKVTEELEVCECVCGLVLSLHVRNVDWTRGQQAGKRHERHSQGYFFLSFSLVLALFQAHMRAHTHTHTHTHIHNQARAYAHGSAGK
jgi:hypothetical protein